MDALYNALAQDKDQIDGYYQKVGQFYNSLSPDEKKVFHRNVQQVKASKPDVAALFSNPHHKAELESYLKNKAGVANVPSDEDMMDTAFF